MAYVNDTGLPSVTTILDPLINSEWFTPECAERGSAVHDACYAHILGGYVIPLRPGWQGYFDSFRVWCDAVEPKVEQAEVRLVSVNDGFCGQPDFIGTANLKDGRGLIDWKTSMGLEKWFRLQGAAYRYLAGLNGKTTKWGGNLRLKSDGGMPLFNYWPDDLWADHALFVGALNLYRFIN